jgi:hypothetical protein
VPARSCRTVAATVALLAIVLLTSFQAPADAEAHSKGIDRFLYALSRVESGGNYRARNHSSGAYGRYQIMPANWGGWARRWVGNGNAHQSPRNQETVARGKIHALYHWLGSWRRVAYWWLTGSSKTTGWSPYASRYVRNVMAIYNGTRIVESRGDIHRFSEKSRAIDYRGTWERAEHPYYRGDRARQAKRKGPDGDLPLHGEPGCVERTERADARQGEGVPRRPVREDGRPLLPQIRRAQPDLHEDIRGFRSAHPDDQGDGHPWTPRRVDRRVRRLGVTAV